MRAIKMLKLVPVHTLGTVLNLFGTEGYKLRSQIQELKCTDPGPEVVALL